MIRDAVAGLGLPLTRMEQRRHHVEEIFASAPAGPDAGRDGASHDAMTERLLASGTTTGASDDR